jgi:hypothetical protein
LPPELCQRLYPLNVALQKKNNKTHDTYIRFRHEQKSFPNITAEHRLTALDAINTYTVHARRYRLVWQLTLLHTRGHFEWRETEKKGGECVICARRFRAATINYLTPSDNLIFHVNLKSHINDNSKTLVDMIKLFLTTFLLSTESSNDKCGCLYTLTFEGKS